MKTLKTQMPARYLRTFEFYAKYYEIPVNRLMESEVYNRATVIIDEPLRTLEFMDRNHCDENLTPISLTFSPQIACLLSRVSKLLRRPLAEFAQDLLTEGAITLGDHIEDAFKKGGMEHGWDLHSWTKESIEFALLAKADKSPIKKHGEGKYRSENDCWDTFMITPPKRYKKRKAASL